MSGRDGLGRQMYASALSLLADSVVLHSKPPAHDRTVREVWLTELKDGDPRPGDRGVFSLGGPIYRVLSPPYVGRILVENEETDSVCHGVVRNFTPVPATRTVTVELTEEEVAVLPTEPKWLGETEMERRRGILSKLAAALEGDDD